MGPLGAWLLHPGGGVSGRAPGHFIPDLSFSPSLSPSLQSKGEMGRSRHWQSRAQHLVTSPERAVGSRAFRLWQASGRISLQGRNKAQIRWSGKHQLLRAVFLVCGDSGKVQESLSREHLPVVLGLYVAV